MSRIVSSNVILLFICIKETTKDLVQYYQIRSWLRVTELPKLVWFLYLEAVKLLEIVCSWDLYNVIIPTNKKNNNNNNNK